FFSSRRRHTRCLSDWSSDVCSSDLITARDGMIIYGRSDAVLNPGGVRIGTAEIYRQVEQLEEVTESLVIGQTWPPGEIGDVRVRSEERRVGKECRAGWWACQ